MSSTSIPSVGPRRALPAELIPALVDFRRRLEGAFGPRFQALLLYGSWARGEQGPDSDVDLAVLIDDLTHAEIGEVVGLGVDTWHATECQLSVQPHDTAHFARMVEREHPYYAAVAREGLPA